jgi:hypothetical protein
MRRQQNRASETMTTTRSTPSQADATMNAHHQSSPSTRTALNAGLLGLMLATGSAHAVTLEDLAKRIEVLENQNAALLAKVDKLEAAQSQAAASAQPQAQAVERDQRSADSAVGVAAQAAPEPATTVSSYGEMGYTRPSKAPEDTNVSVGRAVIFIGHRFDDTTKMVGEFEWENAITSASDSGEAEVEQLYVEHAFANGWRGTAGLYLMPAGLVNQNHEPTSYYGVFRPDVDTKIIPSTWREVGLGLSGTTELGLTWEAGLTTAQDLTKWDPASDEGRVRGPLQAIHGEGQFALARDLGVHGALNWRGPGALFGASVFTGKIGQEQPEFPGNDSRLVLWEVHARYELGGWDLAAECARGTISNTEALNASFLASGTANPTLVPALFYGGYVQAAYRLWQGRQFRLVPFARYEILNTAADYGALNGSEGALVQPNEEIGTLGASLFVGDGVVLKADYRHYRNDSLPSPIPPGFTKGNSLNLGVGYSF